MPLVSEEITRELDDLTNWWVSQPGVDLEATEVRRLHEEMDLISIRQECACGCGEQGWVAIRVTPETETFRALSFNGCSRAAYGEWFRQYVRRALVNARAGGITSTTLAAIRDEFGEERYRGFMLDRQFRSSTERDFLLSLSLRSYNGIACNGCGDWADGCSCADCPSCGSIFRHRTNDLVLDGSSICRTCTTEQGYQWCETHRTWEVDQPICTACYSCSCTCTHLRFSPRGTLKFHDGKVKKSTPKRFVGIELELSEARPGAEIRDILGKWGATAKGDGSIVGPAPAEVITAPAIGDTFIKQVTEITEAIKAKGIEVNDSCGGHVHVDLRGHGYADLMKVAHLFKTIEEGIIYLIPRGRRDDDEEYCGRQRYSYDAVKQCYDKGTYDSIGITQYLWERYQRCNLSAYRDHKTVEFRLWPGVKSAELATQHAVVSAQIVDKALKTTYEELEDWRREASDNNGYIKTKRSWKRLMRLLGNDQRKWAKHQRKFYEKSKMRSREEDYDRDADFY